MVQWPRTARFQCAGAGSIPAASTASWKARSAWCRHRSRKPGGAQAFGFNSYAFHCWKIDLAVARAPFAKRMDPSPGCGSTPPSSTREVVCSGFDPMSANAAGVLKYCEQKGLVSGAYADAVLGEFAAKADAKSGDYLAGESGQILGDGGKKFSIPQAPSYLQSQACDMVLQQAKTFRPGPAR